MATIVTNQGPEWVHADILKRTVHTLDPELEAMEPLAVPRAVALDGPHVREVYAGTWSVPGLEGRVEVRRDARGQVEEACETLEALLDRCELASEDVVTLDVFLEEEAELIAQADELLPRFFPPDTPVQFLFAPPVAADRSIALQAYAVRPHAGVEFTKRYLLPTDSSSARGLVLEYGGFKHCYVAGIIGRDSREGTLKEQADTAFQKADEWLGREGYTIRNVQRTHLYYDGPYQDLRDARHEYFGRYGLTNEEYPASTGIWSRPYRGRVMLKFHAVTGSGPCQVVSKRVDPRTQSQAFAYGSLFVRARWVETDVAKLEVSGTASMSRKGKAVYNKRPKLQANKTRINVMDLVDRCGLSSQDITRYLVYACEPRHLSPWLERLRKDLGGKPPAGSIVAVRARICWFPLTIEEEVTAVAPQLPPVVW